MNSYNVPIKEKTDTKRRNNGLMKEYIHGGDIYRHPDVLDYSANINPLGTPPGVIRAAKDSMERVCHYPCLLYTSGPVPEFLWIFPSREGQGCIAVHPRLILGISGHFLPVFVFESSEITFSQVLEEDQEQLQQQNYPLNRTKPAILFYRQPECGSLSAVRQ